MEIFIAPTYVESSVQAAAAVIKIVQQSSKPLLCVASGDSPVGLYNELVHQYTTNNLNVSAWCFVGLDEWLGMNETDEGSCKYYVNKQLFKPLNINPAHICFFDGRTADAENECSKTEQFIKQHNGIDVAIVGLGLNGHVGMNEPYTSITTRTRVSEIDPLTAQTGQKYFKNQQTLSHGLTLGLATLMEAKNIILMVSGNRKAGIVKQVVEGEISEAVPASLLRNHPGFSIYLDAAAAQLL